MYRLRLFFILIAVALVASLLGLSPSRSAPPHGGGGSVPPGKILYTYNNQTWQMNGDGSGKSTVSLSAVPSRDTYSGHRWSILMSNGEVWATPNNVDFLQITNLQQYDNGDGTITCVILNDGTGARLSWSNGGDSFISVKGIHWVQDASLPVPPPGGDADMSDLYLAIYRLDVSALELEARYQSQLPGPAFDITLAVPVITEPFGYEENFTEHQWSPDGTKIAYKWRNNFEDFGPADLWVADVGPGVTLPVNALTDGVRIVNIATNRIDFPQWSPPGAAEQRIAFRYSNGDLRTVRPDGTGLTTVANVGYGPSFWSPDGNHFVYRKMVQKTFTKREYFLYRIGASGGTSVLLTGDLNKELDKGLLGWGN